MRGIRTAIGSIVIFAVALTVLSSCEELSQDVSRVTVKVPMDRIVFSPHNTRDIKGGVYEGYYQREINFDADSLLEANGMRFLETAELKNLFLGVLKPSDQSLAFLSSARVSISTFEDFHHELVVAETESYNVSDNEIEFMIHDVDVRNYLTSEVFYVRVYCDINNSTQIEEATTLYVDGTLQVIME